MFKRFFTFAILISALLTSSLLIKNSSAQVNTENPFPTPPHFASEENLVIRQKILSDTFVYGERVEVLEEIDGDLFVIGGKVIIDAPVRGSVRAISWEHIDVKNVIEGSFSFVTQRVYISSTADIQKDAYGVAQRFIHEGRIGRNLNLVFSPDSQITIDGKVLGNFYYTQSRPDITEGSFVEGETQKITIGDEAANQNDKNAKIQTIIFHLFHSLSIILIGILLYSTRKNFLNKAVGIYKNQIWSSFLYGVIALFSLPLILGLLFISIAGIPLSFMIFVLAAIIAYISPLLPSIWLAQKIIPSEDGSIGFGHIILGSLLFDVIIMAPAIGLILVILSVISSIGLFVKLFFGRIGSYDQT